MAEAADVAKALEVEMNETLQSMNMQARSRARRASNALRNAALKVLRGKRSGRVYKMPFSGTSYTASAPGEAPAVRTGNLRRNWRQYSLATPIVGGMKITARIKSDMEYAAALDEGRKDGHISPRPYADKIVQEAMPKINQIYNEKFLN